MLFFSAIALGLSITPALAFELPGIAGTAVPDIEILFKTVDKIYKMFLKISVPVAALALACLAAGCLGGSEKTMEKNLAGIKMLGIAMACLYFLPLVVQLAISAIQSSGLVYSP